MIKTNVKIIYCLLIMVISFGLVSCASLNSHQTGRTVGKDNYPFFVNFNFGYIDSEQYLTIKDSGAFYIMEIGTFYGVKENFDLGIKVNSSTHITWISKFQFIGDKSSIFASSVGFDIGAAPLGLLLLGAMSYTSSLSLYNSVHLTDYLTFTVSPRYTYLGFTNFTEEYGFTTRNNIYGYSAGIIIGKEHQFSLELSQYVNNAEFSFDTKPIFSLGYILEL